MNKDIIQEKMTQVSGKLTEKYGLMKEEAEKQVLKFEEGLKHKLS